MAAPVTASDFDESASRHLVSLAKRRERYAAKHPDDDYNEAWEEQQLRLQVIKEHPELNADEDYVPQKDCHDGRYTCFRFKCNSGLKLGFHDIVDLEDYWSDDRLEDLKLLGAYYYFYRVSVSGDFIYGLVCFKKRVSTSTISAKFPQLDFERASKGSLRWICSPSASSSHLYSYGVKKTCYM